MSVEDYFTERDDVLENKLGITDPEEMQALEADVVAYNYSEVISEIPPERMDFDFLKQIHLRLFSDLYPMAGQVRTVDISQRAEARFAMRDSLKANSEESSQTWRDDSGENRCPGRNLFRRSRRFPPT